MSDWETRANSRFDVFRYLTDDQRDRYVALMDCFASQPLSELSTSNIAGEIDGLTPAEVQTLLDRLIEWGNVLAVRGGFRASSIGGRVHRDATAAALSAVATSNLVGGTPTAQPELLGHLVGSLDALRALVAAPRIDRERVAGLTRSIVTDHRAFVDSVSDFYAALAADDTSIDAGSSNNAVMVEHVDVLTSAINRHTPAIAEALTLLEPHLDALGGVDRAQWTAMARWYDDSPAELRLLAGDAMRRLLPATTRGVGGSGHGFSPRADLLRLASWFDSASDTDAERLFAAAFGAFPSRHLLLGPDEPDPRIGASTSWWNAEPIAVPVSLRERGDRVSRGRTSRLPDPGADRQRALTIARGDAERSDAAARELLDIGTANFGSANFGDTNFGALADAKLSPAARTLVLEQLARLLAAADDPTADAEWTDTDLGFTLIARRGGSTVLHSRDGSITVHDLTLGVVPLAGENTGRQATDRSATGRSATGRNATGGVAQ